MFDSFYVNVSIFTASLTSLCIMKDSEDNKKRKKNLHYKLSLYPTIPRDHVFLPLLFPMIIHHFNSIFKFLKPVGEDWFFFKYYLVTLWSKAISFT